MPGSNNMADLPLLYISRVKVDGISEPNPEDIKLDEQTSMPRRESPEILKITAAKFKLNDIFS